MAMAAAQASQICMAPTEAQLSNSDLALGGAQALDVSEWPLMAIWAMDSKTGPCCGWTMDPDRVLGGGSGPDVTVAPGGNSGPSEQHGL